ncbi:MAG: anthranilate phosphoribosyltransferase [Nitrospinaceae bacterium]
MKIQAALQKVLGGEDLSEGEMVSVMSAIMEGAVAPVPMAALLTALHMKGESVGELVGAARVMREKAESVHVKAKMVVDTCGTGGDGGETFNISTAAAFVVAGAGITVAKHGNRAVSSRSGSADVLQCLGVNIEADKAVVEKCLARVGIGFLFAPKLHGAMKYAAAVRKELGFRTLFNLLGPLTNPARAQSQVVGVFAEKWVVPVARVLRDLGCQHAFVVYGEDGLDEISLMADTRVCEVTQGKIREFTIQPGDFGLSPCSREAVKGGTAEQNAAIILDLLEGKSGPPADIVLLNAAAAITAAGKTDSLQEGLRVARESLLSGAAKQKLTDLGVASQG